MALKNELLKICGLCCTYYKAMKFYKLNVFLHAASLTTSLHVFFLLPILFIIFISFLFFFVCNSTSAVAASCISLIRITRIHSPFHLVDFGPPMEIRKLVSNVPLENCKSKAEKRITFGKLVLHCKYTHKNRRKQYCFCLAVLPGMPQCSHAFFGFICFTLEYRNTPASAIPVPSELIGETVDLKKRTEVTMTTTRFTQLPTEWVTGDTLANII